MMYCDETDDEDELATADNTSSLPDIILLDIFRRLSFYDLIAAARTCKAWRQVARDELLWKRLFYRRFKVDPAIGISPGACSWRREFRRMVAGAPRVQTQELLDHSDQVLHVAFSHDGELFATCSKDGYVLVWTSSHPCQLKYFHDMKRFHWKYTQFSQFNESDTMLLVSGVHFGTPHSTSGEIVVFSLEDGFSLRCRAMNKPYDVFGAWFGDRHFLAGELGWLAHLVSCSTLSLHRASQETHSEMAPVTLPLFRFYNRNASTVRAVLVARSVVAEAAVSEAAETEPAPTHGVREAGNPVSLRNIGQGQQGPGSVAGPSSAPTHTPRWDPRYQDAIQYSRQYRDACTVEDVDDDDDEVDLDESGEKESQQECQPPAEESVNLTDPAPDEDIQQGTYTEAKSPVNLADPEIPGGERLLIYATASRTYSPHQVAFKRVAPVRFPSTMPRGLSLSQRRTELRERENRTPPPEPDWLDFKSVAHRFTQPDAVVDLHGHIIGMAVSPDSRHLYVNVRAWPEGASVGNPLDPPPIAQEIDLHVIDLATLKPVGTLLRAHKAFTPNNECFFIFLDVSHHFIASGAEDRQGYLWDRHYGALVARLPHGDVVNCVAFNPRDPGMLVSVSDDRSIRVWRSANHARRLGLL